MKPLRTLLASLMFAAVVPAVAAELPDLEGRVVQAVTENAYTPLNFADPESGEGIGWEYDAFNEIAKRLNMTVEWNLASWDTMIQAVRVHPAGGRATFVIRNIATHPADQVDGRYSVSWSIFN